MPIAIPDVSSHVIGPRDMGMHTGHMLHGSSGQRRSARDCTSSCETNERTRSKQHQQVVPVVVENCGAQAQ